MCHPWVIYKQVNLKIEERFFFFKFDRKEGPSLADLDSSLMREIVPQPDGQDLVSGEVRDNRI